MWSPFLQPPRARQTQTPHRRRPTAVSLEDNGDTMFIKSEETNAVVFVFFKLTFIFVSFPLKTGKN